MKSRLLLAGTAILAGVTAAHAGVSVSGGAAIVTLPPLPGLAHTFVSPTFAPGVAMSAPAFGVVPVYGFAMEFTGDGRIGAFASGFYAAGTSGFTAEPIPPEGGAFALASMYPGYGVTSAYVTYADGPDPATASAGAQKDSLPGQFNGYAFDIGATPEGGNGTLCHDEEACVTLTGAPGTGGPLAYATVLGDGGVLIAAAGLFPEGAITLTETAGFRYFGGQAGMSVALDLGNARATAQIGGLFRSLTQTHRTTLDVDFAVPVDGGTLTVGQTVFGDETLAARYFGTFFGVSVESDTASRLVARFDVGAAPLLAMAQYTGFQSATLDVDGPDTNVHFTTDLPTVDVRDMQAALLLNIGGEVGFRFGGAAKITFGGFVEMLSAAPELLRAYNPAQPTLDYPTTGFVNDGAAYGGATGVGASLTTQPVGIGYQPMLTYGASVRLTIGLGGP